jgi:hypothetical protein
MEGATDEPMADVAVELPPIQLNILAAIKTSQMQNGIRHGDYQRYRQYCSRRLHRLRKSMKVRYVSIWCGVLLSYVPVVCACGDAREILLPTRYACSSQLTHGKRYTVKGLDVESLIDKATEPRHLLMPLVKAERAWSYAMQLREAGATEPRKRQHMMRRMTKAKRLGGARTLFASRTSEASHMRGACVLYGGGGKQGGGVDGPGDARWAEGRKGGERVGERGWMGGRGSSPPLMQAMSL